MGPFHDNVFFLGVCRIAEQQGIVVVSHSHNSQTNLGDVKDVLKRPDMQMMRGKHYCFTVKTQAWHLIAGGNFRLFNFDYVVG
jgi:hypothetical protein